MAKWSSIGFGFITSPDEPVLKRVSFRIEPGEKIAVVGATGSGKTTTIKLLNRFYDIQKGSIKVSGVDVRDWDLQALRRHIGVVLQDVFLFSGDVRANLALGDPSIPMERIERRGAIANVDRFIRRLPDGSCAQVRERGSNFSGGQRQLFSLARVLVFQPEILVMDEATSSVDTETEALDPRRARKSHARPNLPADRPPAIDDSQCRPNHRAASRRGPRDR